MPVDGVVPRRILAAQKRQSGLDLDRQSCKLDGLGHLTGEEVWISLVMSLHCVYLLLDGHPPKHTASQLAVVAQVPRPNHLPPPRGARPELNLAVPVRDYLDAKACAKRLQPDFGDGSKGWSIVHGFYICMGPFHVRYIKGHNAEVTGGWLGAVDVEDHVKRGMLKPEEVISQEEIMDNGKADWLVKCMLGFQVLWLSTQCVARATQHLPINPLEISTLVYVPFVLLALWFWWDKPYNIDVPTLIDGQSRLRGAPLLTAYLTKQDIPGFQPLPYRPFALVRMSQGYREWLHACA